METLSHPEARRRLLAALDGRLEVADRAGLDAHLTACAECRAYAAELNTVERSLRHTFTQRWSGARGPRNDLAQRLAYHGEQPMSPTTRLNLAGGLAALLLIAAIVFVLQIQTSQPAAGSTPDDPAILSPAATIQAETPPPFVTVVLEPTIMLEPTPTSAPALTPAAPNSPPLTYTVMQGDTCLGIATAYAVTAADMLTANGLENCETLAVGQELVIPYYATDAPPPICPVTRAPDRPFVPPAPYDSVNPQGPPSFWHGSADLWTRLLADGVWHGLPYDGHGFTQKLFWWREGYDWQAEPIPALTVSSTRLDVPGDTYVSDWASNGYAPDTLSFINSQPILPTAGCWQITGRYGESELSFVVWVAPALAP